jgi:hypothetical protein
MPSIVGLMGRMIRKRRQPEPAALPVPESEVKPRFGEILAVSTIPDFAGLPIELWPGYRNRAAAEEAEEDSRCAAHSRLVRWND